MKIFLNDRIINKSLTYYPLEFRLYFKIQFYNNEFFNVRKKLNKLISKYFPQAKIYFVLNNGKKNWRIILNLRILLMIF